MKKIALLELRNKNYESSKISNYELYGKCIKCNIDFIYKSVKKFLKNRKNKIKLEILKKWTSENNFSCLFLLSSDEILKKNYRLARKKHHENNKKNLY